MIDHALWLAGCGLQVFPIWPTVGTHCACPKGSDCGKNAGKHPIGGHGHRDATTSQEQIRAWWTEHPNASIGISAVASGLLIVDIDPRNDGMESLRRLEAAYPLPTTLAVKTGGGGAHLYYKLPEGRFPPNLKKLGFPGIDIKTKGYVVAPPSLHQSGNRYEWACQDPPADLSAEFINFVQTAPPDAAVDATDYTGGEPATPAIVEATWQALLAHGPSVQGQGGDAHAFQVGSILLNDFDLTWEDAWTLASRWNAHFPENHWTDAKLATKIRNGCQYASGARGAARRDFLARIALIKAVDLRPFEQNSAHSAAAVDRIVTTATTADHNGGENASIMVEDPAVESSIRVEEIPSFLEMIKQAYADLEAYRSGTGATQSAMVSPIFNPAVDLLTANFPATSWLVQGLVTTEAVCVVAGEPKSTKSWSAIEIALAVATNTPAFGEFATGPAQSVAMFLPEDSAKSVRNRLRALAAARALLPENALARLHVSCRQPMDLQDDAQLARLIASCRVLPSMPALVVLDPMRDLHGADEDSSKDMADVLGRLRAVRDIIGASVMFVHHSAKVSADVSKRRRGQKMRGSGAIHGAIDCGLYIGNIETDNRANWTTDVEAEIKAAQGAGVFKLDLHVMDDDVGEAVSAEWKVRPIGTEDDTAAGEKEVQAVVRGMAKIGGEGTVKDIRPASGVSWNSVTRALTELEQRGWVVPLLRGKRQVGYKLSDAILIQEKAEAATRGQK